MTGHTSICTALPAALFILFVSCQPLVQEKETPVPEGKAIVLDLDEANRLSKMAFHCIDTEYPNKLGQVLGDSSYLAEPRVLHPAFYGCFDWHSAVHGHWSLVRLLKTLPGLDNADSIRMKLAANLTPANIRAEVAYFDDEHNKNYERTYGWAWLLKLVEELHTWEDPQGRAWRSALRPLEELIVEKYLDFLPKLSYPIRIGEHSNTAFGLAFAWDYALATGHTALAELLRTRSLDFYAEDNDCPLSWEPGGFDFLSPCLEEAEIMSRVLEPDAFSTWFEHFLPDLTPLEPAVPLDRSDGKIVHLDGLNFSRAWVLYTIAGKLPDRRPDC